MPASFLLATSRYLAPPETIALHLAAHREWLDAIYARGLFVLSGRLATGEGGFMLARALDRAGLEAILATDPFRVAGLLTHDILELHANRWCDALTALEDMS